LDFFSLFIISHTIILNSGRDPKTSLLCPFSYDGFEIAMVSRNTESFLAVTLCGIPAWSANIWPALRSAVFCSVLKDTSPSITCTLITPGALCVSFALFREGRSVRYASHQIVIRFLCLLNLRRPGYRFFIREMSSFTIQRKYKPYEGKEAQGKDRIPEYP